MTNHPPRSRSTRSGIVLALAAAALFGGVNASVRAAIGLGLDPLWAAGLAYVSGGLLLSPWLRSARIPRADRPRLALVIGAGAIAAPLLLYEGLARTGAVVSSLLLNLEMAFTSALAFVALRERLHGGRELVGLLLIAAGAILVSVASASGGGTTALVGALLVAAAALGWGIDNVASTPLAERHDPRALIAWKTLVGGSVVIVISFVIAGAPRAPATAFGLALGAGVVGVAVSSVLFYAALGRIGATRTVVLFSASSLVGALTGHFALREPLGALHIVALTLILGGVALVALGRSSPGTRPPMGGTQGVK